MSRKPRSDAKLLSLPAYQQDKLRDWLVEEGIGYADALQRLHDDFNVETSLGALSDFYARVCAPFRLARAAMAAQALPDEAGGLAVDWSAPSAALLQQKYFELLAAPRVDKDELASFGMLVADIGRAQLEKEKLRTKRQTAAVNAWLRRKSLGQGEAGLRLQREKFEDQKLKIAEQTKRLRDAGASLPDGERTAILDHIDRVLLGKEGK